VKKTVASNQISSLQTVRAEEGKDLVLAVTLRNGSNVKYLIKSVAADTSDIAVREGLPKASVSSWELSGLATALSVGDSALSHGVVLKISD
jgi:hypothetical protein